MKHLIQTFTDHRNDCSWKKSFISFRSNNFSDLKSWVEVHCFNDLRKKNVESEKNERPTQYFERRRKKNSFVEKENVFGQIVGVNYSTFLLVSTAWRWPDHYETGICVLCSSSRKMIQISVAQKMVTRSNTTAALS